MRHGETRWSTVATNEPSIQVHLLDGARSPGEGAGPMTARDLVLQLAQVLTVLTLSPMIQGVIAKLEEPVQRAESPAKA